MTAPKPEQGGWWDDFVHNLVAPLAGPQGMLDALGGANTELQGVPKWLEDGIRNYGNKVGQNLHADFVEPMKTAEGRMQWLKDWTTPGPGEMGAVLGKVGKAPASKALAKLRAAAVRSEDGRIFEGQAHPLAFMNGEDAGATFSGHADDEGFIHPTKGYITRRQAKEMGYFAKSEKDIPQTVQVAEAGDSPMLLDALEKNGGFTFDPYSSSFVESGGVMVGGVPGQKGWKGTHLSPEVLDKFRADNAKLLKKEGMFIGGWKDKDGTIYLDVSERLPREQAEKVGRERGELAGYDLDSGETLGWDLATRVRDMPDSHFDPEVGDDFGAGLLGYAPTKAPKAPQKAAKGPEKIVAATIFDPESGKYFDAVNHEAATVDMEGAGIPQDRAFSLWDTNAGFRTSTGRVVSREEAAAIAKASKQIAPEHRADANEFGDKTELAAEWLKKPKKIESPAVHIPKETYTPERRGVFDFSPEGGVPATEYREPAPLPFESAPRPKAGPSELAQRISTSKKVEKRIISDMEKGLGLGGTGWYGTLPLRRYFESIGKPEGFADFNNAGGAGSIRTPTHNELTNLSLLRYANKRGIPYEEARAEFFRRNPGTMKPTFMGIHGKVYDRALAAGKMVPSSPSAGELKVPHYTHDRNLGATGVPLDTHELRAMAQALGIDEELVKTAAVDAESYNLMTAPYRRVAKKFGLHPDQVQAGRWIGGGKQTGLKSQPKGDFMQTLEDGLLYTARTKGRDESPKGLRSLWDAIAAGDDFFMPFGGEGGFPVR